jgi:hypothetical protein
LSIGDGWEWRGTPRVLLLMVVMSSSMLLMIWESDLVGIAARNFGVLVDPEISGRKVNVERDKMRGMCVEIVVAAAPRSNC